MNVTKFSNLPGVLCLLGESGVGKSFTAKKIFNLSNKYKQSFVHVNIAATTPSLFESELFGHKKGSFTGAIADKRGYVDQAQGGTLFLDEIAELGLTEQKKILMLIEEGIYYPVGSSIPLKFEGRIIVATNKNLDELKKNGSLREDLYYRIQPFQMRIPSLREKENRLEIIQQMMAKLQGELGKEDIVVQEDFMHELYQYSYPGNIRELRNILTYALCTCEKMVTKDNLPAWFWQKSVETSFQKTFEGGWNAPYHEALHLFEKEYLNYALKIRGQKINKTAREIGLNKVTLLSKIRKYGINGANRDTIL